MMLESISTFCKKSAFSNHQTRSFPINLGTKIQ